MAKFTTPITVEHFLSLFFLSNIDYFYCYVNFPEDKWYKLNGRWECSSLIKVDDIKTDRTNYDKFIKFWGKLNVHKVDIFENDEGFYNGFTVDGVGLRICVDYSEIFESEDFTDEAV